MVTRLKRRGMHPSVTLARVLKLKERHRCGMKASGICTHCGGDTDNVLPDMANLECWICGNDTVYGVDQFLHVLTSNDNRSK